MTLVDTSVWIDHFREGNSRLRDLLVEGQVVMHPMILGELALGNLPKRSATMRLLERLPSVRAVPDSAVLHAVESLHLWGTGIGWVDAHLLAAARVAQTTLWTLDQRLSRVAASADAGTVR